MNRWKNCKMGLYLCGIWSVSYAQWSSMIHKQITPDDIHASFENTLIYTKQNTARFTQLLFSWNALRPKKGHFSFYIQAHNAITKKWGIWHHMADWGASIQRSYQNPGDSFSRYVHVRLEMKQHVGDAFRIKMVAHDGAPLSHVKGFAVTMSHKQYFVPENYSWRIEQLPSVLIKNVPFISQFSLNHPHNGRICSPTSCTMVARYLTGCMIDPIDFAEKSFDIGLDAYGSWPFNMAHAFEKCNGRNWFFNTRLNSFAQLHRQLARNIPIVVSVRGTLQGAPRPYPFGHLMVVVGWDAKHKQVICHDPAHETNKMAIKRYAFNDFVRAWERSHRLVYWVEPI